MKKQVVRFVSDSLQVRKCAEEVRTPGRGPIASTKLREFWPSLFMKPKEREVSSRRTIRVIVKVYTHGVGHACGE